MTREEMETMWHLKMLARLATRYNLSEETVEEIITIHNGDAKAAIRDIKAVEKVMHKVQTEKATDQ